MDLPFADWLPRQRWYAGRGRTIKAVHTRSEQVLTDDLAHVILDVEYAEGGSEGYQAFVTAGNGPLPEYARRATIGYHNGRTAFDALYDEASARELIGLIDAGATVGNLRFVPEPDVDLPVDTATWVVEAEQSNTSVIFDTRAILKVFRRMSCGTNPDVELNRVLGRAGCPNVARLLGAIESDDDGRPCSLAMVTEFAANSADGWAMATASARDLFSEQVLHANEVGGDFAAESCRLGEAVAAVHRTLAEELGRSSEPPRVDQMIARLESSVEQVPQLARYAGALRERFRDAGAASVDMQRIHGDLHLGQVLRTTRGWMLIDFEGEPGQPLDERRRPDSVLRDVAGMLRSYQYAASHLLVDQFDEPQMEERAQEWIDRNRDAFCAGYAAVAGTDPRECAALLCAYELDKAVYEAAYESRFRPAWLHIPMASIERLLG